MVRARRRGRPVHAECAGYLYLTSGVVRDGRLVRRWPGRCPSTGVRPRLTLGYRDGVALTDSVLYRAGDRVTGHEFHRSTVAPGPVARGAGTPTAPVSTDVHAGARLLPAHPPGRRPGARCDGSSRGCCCRRGSLMERQPGPTDNLHATLNTLARQSLRPARHATCWNRCWSSARASTSTRRCNASSTLPPASWTRATPRWACATP